MKTDYYYILRYGIKSGPYPYNYIKDSLLDKSMPADQPVFFNNEWVEASNFVDLVEGRTSEIKKSDESEALPPAPDLKPLIHPEPVNPDIGNDKTDSPQQPTSIHGLPYPTIPKAPSPTIPPLSTQQTKRTEEKNISLYGDEEPESFMFQEDLNEEGETRLYRQAKFAFFRSFGAIIPFYGLYLAYVNWQKTKVWSDAANSSLPNQTTNMVLTAVRCSFAWFIASCVLLFMGLTSFSLPGSLGALALSQVLLGILVILMTLIIHILSKGILDEEVSIYDANLMALRSVAGVFCFTYVNIFMFHGVFGGFAILVALLITCYAIMSFLTTQTSNISQGRVFVLALLSWFILELAVSGLSHLFS